MTERIKKLIEQATTKEEFYPAGCNGYPEYRYDFDKEKFAELIVKECMGLVDGYTYPVQTQSHTIYHIANETIKAHFGIEE